MTRRCRHKKGCSHENCDCKVFTSPCLTHSKVGLCLHLQWSQFNINMDVDFSPPCLPVSNIDQYDGKIEKKRAFLERMKFIENMAYICIEEDNEASAVSWLKSAKLCCLKSKEYQS